MRTSVLETLNGSLCDAVLETQWLRAGPGVVGALEPLRRAAGQSRRVVPLPPPLPAAAAPRARADASHSPSTELNRRAMAWYADHDQLRSGRRVRPGGRRGRRPRSPALWTRLALPLHYDGRMDTLERAARLVRRRRHDAISRDRRLRVVGARDDGPGHRGRTIPRHRRRGNVRASRYPTAARPSSRGSPRLRAAMMPRRRRTGARGRRHGARPAARGQRLASRRDPRCAASPGHFSDRPTVLATTFSRPSDVARSCRRCGYAVHRTGRARAARRAAGRVVRGPAARRGGPRGWSSRPTSSTTD